MECLYLHPLTQSEIRRSPGNFLEEFLAGNLRPKITASGATGPSELPGLLVAGGYPESIQRDSERADRWRRNYVRSVVERDIRDIAVSLHDGRRRLLLRRRAGGRFVGLVEFSLHPGEFSIS